MLEVREGSDGFAFVTEYVEGTKPRDTKHARRFLGRISDAFIEAGLPPWQVSPSNPRSVGNLIETEDGDYKIIDLESSVVTPMVPITGLWGAARDGHLPAFDDIDVPRLRAFVVRREAELRSALGPVDFRELRSAIDQYDYHETQWHDAHWSRSFRGERYARFSRTSRAEMDCLLFEGMDRHNPILGHAPHAFLRISRSASSTVSSPFKSAG